MAYKVKRKSVDAETFVRAWQASATIDEVVEKTGMGKSNVYFRSSQLRKRGVNLKLMPTPGRGKLDVASLNKLCE